jgi:RNA polymerase-binding transcription factor
MSKRNAKKAAKSKAPAARSKSAPRAAKGRAIAASKPKPPTKRKVAGKKMASRAKASSIVLPPDYRPSEDEPFMNERQRLYFRQKLLTWKEEIIRQTRETLAGLHEESTQHADLADRATSETDRALELRARDRQRKLIAKIDAALARIEDGSYGYCEETGEPIGLKRLDARPIATLSVEAQERHERRERVYRED